MALNLNKDAVYRTAKPKDKDYTISDGQGLHLLITAKGSKLWQYVYTFEGKRCKLALGSYPTVTLEAARRKAVTARISVSEGIDPSEDRRAGKKVKALARLNDDRSKAGLPVIDSFEDVARKWLASIDHLTTKATSSRLMP
jgi:hypothetical protein